MMRNYPVQKICMKYLVPFTFEESFEEAMTAVEDLQEQVFRRDPETKEQKPTREYRKLWTRRTVQDPGMESDLYTYVKNEFRFDSMHGALAEERSGGEWLLWNSEILKQASGKKPLELLYFQDPLKKECRELPGYWDVRITNVGIILFRNQLGFLWYEISLPKNGSTSDGIMQFQNRFKELNRGERDANFWIRQPDKTDAGIVLKDHGDRDVCLRLFSMGEWIADKLSFLSVHFLAERKCAGLDTSSAVTEGGSVKKVPDKAVLFTYCSFGRPDGPADTENTEKPGEADEPKNSLEQETLAYYFANGYKTSYHFHPDTAAGMKRPFGGAIWYATQEGAAYLSWPEKDNTEVFNSLIPGKFRNDYFCLWVKVLYQSYSLLVYAQKIQSKVSAVKEKYLQEPFDQRITDLFGEINLFLTKSMAASVSHIHHQSEFYVYLKKQLRIREDVESVTAGLAALDMLKREQRQRAENERIQEEWKAEKARDKAEQEERDKREEREKRQERIAAERNDKLQAIMGLFALLGIASALVDCFDYIQKFRPGGEWSASAPYIQTAEVIFICIIGIVGSITVYFAVKAIWQAFRKKAED